MAIPTIAVNDVLQARIACSCGDQLALNIRHYLVTSVVGSPILITDLADEFDVRMNSEWINVLAADAEYRGTGIRRLTPNPTIEYPSTVNAGSGTWGGTTCPRQVAGLITLRSSTPGRKGRGRVYVPFVPITAVDADTTATPAYLVALGTMGNQLIADFTCTVGVDSATVSPRLRERTAPHTLRAIDDHIIRDRFATQRRRGSFGATNVMPF